MAGVSSFERDIEILIARDLSPEAQARMLAEVAIDERNAASAKNAAATGEPATPTVFVDGRKGVSEFLVRPGGIIVYDFGVASLAAVLTYVEQQLLQHSPRRSGRYAKSHVLFADGVELDGVAAAPADTEEFIFLNLQPYARKIEGDLKRAPSSRQAPDGVYEVVAALAQRRFKSIAKVGFTYMAPSAGAVAEWAETRGAKGLARRVRRGNPKLHTEWLSRQPAIWVSPR